MLSLESRVTFEGGTLTLTLHAVITYKDIFTLKSEAWWDSQ